MSHIIIITDEEKPTIESCPPNITQKTDDGKPTAAVTWVLPIASDNSNETVEITCFPASGANFTIGKTNVTCKAVDSSGNKATCNFPAFINGM